MKTHRPSNATAARLRAFIAVTATPPLDTTLARTMAQTTLAYRASAYTRCNGLSNGTIPGLRSASANRASVTQIVTTAASLYAGVVNHVQNTLQRLASTDTVAAALLKAWNSTAPPPAAQH